MRWIEKHWSKELSPESKVAGALIGICTPRGRHLTAALLLGRLVPARTSYFYELDFSGLVWTMCHAAAAVIYAERPLQPSLYTARLEITPYKTCVWFHRSTLNIYIMRACEVQEPFMVDVGYSIPLTRCCTKCTWFRQCLWRWLIIPNNSSHAFKLFTSCRCQSSCFSKTLVVFWDVLECPG